MKLSPEWFGALALAAAAFVVAYLWRHVYRDEQRDDSPKYGAGL